MTDIRHVYSEDLGKLRKMGLAASQSRFLLLTARQNNLSSQLLMLQNRDMAIERQTSILAEEYNKKQNAQYVTYEDSPLDFNTIMQPNESGYNNMITNSAGAVVLTSTQARSLGLNSMKGSGQDFINAAQTADSVNHSAIAQVYKTFGNGLVADTSETDSMSAKEIEMNSAYKYNDNIMNNAVVKVQAATVLGLAGYLYDDEGNINQDATLEYAMGIPKREMLYKSENSKNLDGSTLSLSQLACICTLDNMAYTQENVHKATNDFVESAVTAMANVMANKLGVTDATQKALDYATQKTMEKYRDAAVETYDKGLDTTVANSYIGADKKEVDNTAMFNSTNIIVSTKAENQVATTDCEVNNGKTNYAYTTTTYNGKNILINTAQLTATFLNYFDAGMQKQVGSDAALAVSDELTKKTDTATNVIDLRYNLDEMGMQSCGTPEHPEENEIVKQFKKSNDVYNYTEDDWKQYPEGKYPMPTGTINWSLGIEAGQKSFVKGYNQMLPESCSNIYLDGTTIQRDSNGNVIASGANVGQNVKHYYAIGANDIPLWIYVNQVEDENVKKTKYKEGKEGEFMSDTDPNYDKTKPEKDVFYVTSGEGDDQYEIMYVAYKDKDGNYVQDQYGNYRYIACISDETFKNMPNDTSIDLKYLVNTGKKTTSVIGGFGTTNEVGTGSIDQINSVFDCGTTGIFGSKNLKSDSYANLVRGSSSSSSYSSSTNANNAYSKTFCDGLYNALKQGGWVVDDSVKSSSYLGQQILQGNFCLQQFNTSNSWAVIQAGDSDNGLKIVDDKDTREQAKTEYEAKTVIIKTKKAFLENQIDALKTQSEAVEKEKDSIKSIIEKEQSKLQVFAQG